MSQPEQRWKHTMCPSLWPQIFLQRSVWSHGLIEIQRRIIWILIFWTISGLTVSDHHFDPLPKQELPASWARHTFILPWTQTEPVGCSCHCCSSWSNTQSSVHLSLHPEHLWGQTTGHLVSVEVANASVTETDYMRGNSPALTESLSPFPNRMGLIPDESHNCSALNKNFLTITGGKMWTGSLWSITLVFRCYTVLSTVTSDF